MSPLVAGHFQTPYFSRSGLFSGESPENPAEKGCDVCGKVWSSEQGPAGTRARFPLCIAGISRLAPVCHTCSPIPDIFPLL